MATFTKKNTYNLLIDLGIGLGVTQDMQAKGIEVKLFTNKIAFQDKHGATLSHIPATPQLMLLIRKGKLSPAGKQELGGKIANAIKLANEVHTLNNKKKKESIEKHMAHLGNIVDEDNPASVDAAAYAVAQSLVDGGGIGGSAPGLVTSFLDDHEMIESVDNTGDGWLEFIDEEPVEETGTMELVPQVNLGAATLMYQAVNGTDKNSVYNVVAIGSAFNVAARFINKTLSVRVDWDLTIKGSYASSMNQITEISKIGFDSGTGAKSTHMSMHLDCGTHDIATKALGAVLTALADVNGANIKTPAPSFKLLMSAAI